MKKMLIGLYVVLILSAPVTPANTFSSLHQYHSQGESTEPLNRLETTHFVISYREDHAPIAREVADLAEDVYDDVISFMGYTPRENIQIYIQPLRYNFAFGIITDIGDLTIEWGCPFSTESFGLDPLTKKWILADGLSSVLLLEMVGVTNSVFLENQLWLGLGIPVYCASGGHNTMVPVAIHVLRETNNLPGSLDDIQYENYGLLSQPLAFTAIDYMVDEYGEDKFHTFLGALKAWDQGKTSKQNIDSALQKACGITIQEFEEGWVSSLQEVPLLQSECTAVQITDSWGFKVASSWLHDTILYTGVFQASSVNKNLDIFVMNADGSTVQKLTESLDSDFDPKFSPDGTKIAFTSLRDGYANIYIMDRDGSHEQQITYDASMDYMGSWSPDGEKIAFTSARHGNYDVYIMNADGSHIQQVTNHPGAEGWPVFSPDGQKILFVSDRNGTYDLYTMNSDGSSITQLTNTPEHENYPQYSHDGEKIVFSSRHHQGAEICIMNSDGTQRKTVLSQPVVFIDEKTLPSLIGYPVWSGNDEDIVFTIGTQICTMPVEQRDLTWVLIPLAIGLFVIWWMLQRR
jgi:hypothetical protein